MKVIVRQAEVYRCTSLVDFDSRIPYPPTVCHQQSYEHVRNVAAEMLGKENVREARPVMAAEDFAFYLEQIPGAYINIGVGNPTKYGHSQPNAHTPSFEVDEDVLPIGAALHTNLAFSYLRSARICAEQQIS